MKVKFLYLDLIIGIKNSSKSNLNELPSNNINSKTKSDGKLGTNLTHNNNNGHKSANINNKEVNDLFSIVTQVDEKIDIQNLTNIEEIKDYYEYTENCLQVISSLLKPSDEKIEELKLDLPEKFLKKKLAIFDLDETLIHCELKNPLKAEKIITIKLPNGNKTRVIIFNLGWYKY